ncbi:MAG: DUF4115 domain-containing protein [Deltaproteobacteria bacterium]|nr:DUF4115 domain-containing protein [Deltaproteobacteria bacterium]OIP66073.1 MAG: hypothetical protein AUK30_03280 [Nitrospirae bacterium CG2_30_70_394]PIU79024.1 MAG: hypothetical protein COS73_05480 [Nitrospirae bacterium CG06_land_8_20_14_3_00_70_43]PIW83084.1 MAG: hypothetical protein COZ96_05265 [Nitrospirae bacterium CG_4_8_14_3_um_filter_70_85]NCP95389.1 DUF4115 domain-containing protein [Deltaproteobacteria bacterium]
MPDSLVTLGQYLCRERELRGMSLAQVSDKTKVKIPFLEAIEAGEHAVLPSPIYVRGFLRSYAAFIGLDAGDVLQRYQEALDQRAEVERQAAPPAPPPPPPSPGAIVDRFLRQADDSRMRDRRKHLVVGGIFGVYQGRNRVRSRSLLLGSIAGAGLLVVVGIYLITQLVSAPKEKVITYRENMARTLATDLPKPVRAPREIAAAAPLLDTLPAHELGGGGPRDGVAPPPLPAAPPLAVPPLAAPPLAAPGPPIASAPAPLVAPPLAPPAAAGHRIVIDAHERSWLAVRIDNTPAKEFMLAAGEQVQLTARTGFDLTVGNAGGIALTVDGTRRPPLGAHGQVVRDLHLP